MKNFKIVTYGCQINEYESEKFREALLSFGYSEVEKDEDADLILLNSCAVREKADLKLLSKIGHIRKIFEKQGHPVSVVTGCVASIKEQAIKRVGEKSVITLFKGYEPLDDRIRKLRKLLSVMGEKKISPARKVFAYVPIIYGCNDFCSYCIVPAAKGRERSRTKEEILEEVNTLVKNGTQEVVLLGQNINHYGLDLGYKNGFIKILEDVDKVSGLKRLRYLTPYPANFTLSILERMRNLKKLCSHFHLPVQSGSNKILKSMKRGYTREQYIKLIDSVRMLFPDASITTDIIVGFPGESEKDYNETKALVEYVQFDRSFVAAYSKRPNTPAAVMEEQIDEKEKKKRLNDFLSLQNAISLKKNRFFIGKTVEILIESIVGAQAFGRIPQDKLVIVEGCAARVGDIIKAEIVDADFIHLRGK
jgi:tRNA-2-methylthio-N6-dimethylallyladenosine synthase